MKIIIDECVPSLVKKLLPHRPIATVQEMGWAGIKNGELLGLIDAEFEIFITSDKNLRYQQNLTDRKIAVILLPSNQVPVVEKLIPELDEILDEVRPQDFIEI